MSFIQTWIRSIVVCPQRDLDSLMAICQVFHKMPSCKIVSENCNSHLERSEKPRAGGEGFIQKKEEMWENPEIQTFRQEKIKCGRKSKFRGKSA